MAKIQDIEISKDERELAEDMGLEDYIYEDDEE